MGGIAGRSWKTGPPNRAQLLYSFRDLCSGFRATGSAALGLLNNISFALRPYTDEICGMVVILGSDKWAEFSLKASPEERLPCKMEAGDALLLLAG
jgi:ectoine hydroxylase-related dioxygenase (phytanoyl-CoA dioxygenase family)